jgi:outer membrane receptor for ferric coprogen and ferric-rhodotorulic acid
MKTRSMLLTVASRSRLFLSIALVIATTISLGAQAQPAASPAPATPAASVSENSDVVELSPFEVRAEDISGYTARSSLAGSRLNTALKDIPSSISVMTQEFLRDIAATTPEDAMLYSLNVENNVEFADAKDAGGNFTRGIAFNTFSGRVRGIADAGRTRDFFDTDLQGDTYNLDTITISSGPNAVIYGLGGTGGIINTSFKQARLRNNAYTLGLRFDSAGSARATVDLNHTILKDRLAVRLVMLNDDIDTFRDFSSGKQDRRFVAVTAQPFKSTKIRGYYEDVDINKLLPRNVMAYDGGVTAYLDYVAAGGAPIIDNSLRTVPVALRNLFEASTNNRNVYVVDKGGLTLLGPLSGGTAYSVQTIEPSRFAPLASDRFSWSLPRSSPLANREFNIFGDTTGRHMYGRIAGAILTQQFGRNLSLELGYNYESGWTDFWNMAQPIAASIRVDPNRYLPDGRTPNPHAGQMYVEDLGQSTRDYNKMYGFRAAASYHLDLTKKSPWLGAHDFVGLYTRERKDRYWSWIRLRIVPPDRVSTYQYDPRGALANGQTTQRFYIDPLKGTFMDTSFDPLWGGLQPDGSKVYALMNSPSTGQSWSQLWQRDGLMTAVQSHWFKDRLITTVGRRESRSTLGVATDGSTPLPAGNGIAYGFPTISRIDHSKDTWSPTQKASALSYGGVWHVNKQWSVFYNWSDIFESPSPSRYADNTPIPAATGEGFDYGVMWEGFKGRINLRVGMYQTTSANVNNCDWCTDIRNNVLNLEKRIGAPGRSSDFANAYAQAIPEGQIVASAPTPAFNPGTFSLESPTAYWHMSADRKSRGYEIETTANLTSSISIRATAALNKATDSNLGNGWLPYIAARYAYWKQWAQWEQSARWTNNTNPIGSTNNSVTNDFARMLPAYITIANSTGLRVTQNAGWRINGTGKYAFREGRLRGLNLGGSVRYREAPTLGYLTLPANNPFPDWPTLTATYVAPSMSNPVFGGDRMDIDGFASYDGRIGRRIKYRVALNVRNVFNRIDLVKQRVDGFGNTAVYTFTEPRAFILSTEFTY